MAGEIILADEHCVVNIKNSSLSNNGASDGFIYIHESTTLNIEDSTFESIPFPLDYSFVTVTGNV